MKTKQVSGARAIQLTVNMGNPNYASNYKPTLTIACYVTPLHSIIYVFFMFSHTRRVAHNPTSKSNGWLYGAGANPGFSKEGGLQFKSECAVVHVNLVASKRGLKLT